MQRFADQLNRLGRVVTFDYPYMKQGRKSPDRLPTLVAAHREALEALRRSHDGPVVLAGKSMGSRVGCHLALEESAAALVCFGYPLRAARPGAALRDAVLRDLETPVFFAQGTRDPLCPLDLFDSVRATMKAPHAVHLVDAGDHSLQATKTALKARGITQADVEREIFVALERFLAESISAG